MQARKAKEALQTLRRRRNSCGAARFPLRAFDTEYKNSNLLIPDGQSMGTYRFCNENVRFKIFDKNKYCNAEPAQYILSIGFRPEDTTSEQMLNCIRNLIDIGIIAKDDASS